MNYKLSITQQGNKFVAGIEGAHQATASTPLQALRTWIHHVGVGIVKYQHHDKTSQEVAEVLGMSEVDFLQIAVLEAFLPPMTMVYGTQTVQNS